MAGKRENVPSWDEVFMSTAKLWASRSKDPNTQVGAVAAQGKTQLSVGYNGATRGFSDDDFPWEREGDVLDTKYPFVVHAELNCILNFKGIMRELEGSTFYVTHYPCNECAKALVQVGVREVVYETYHSVSPELSAATVKMFDKAGVLVRQYQCES